MTCDGVLEPTASETQKGLTELFENDLSAARAKVEGRDQTSCRPDASPPVKTKPSFGHRAGFDAFMTGYSFACIALTLKKSPLEENSGWLSGVEEMRNKLANRGKTFALQITKSHFTSSSLRHKTAQSIISSFFKSNSGSDE